MRMRRNEKEMVAVDPQVETTKLLPAPKYSVLCTSFMDSVI